MRLDINKIASKEKKKNPVLVAIVLIATLFRLYLVHKIPLLLQGDAKYDDFLIVKYADNIYHHLWLGAYDHTTLLKTASASLLLAIGRFLGIGFGMFVACIYVLAVLVLVHVFNKLIRNDVWATCTYLFILYSPIMFHTENVQKIYRGGYIVSFSLLVISGVVGVFISCKSKIRQIATWVILESVSLPIFWFLKEDSVWILPFVVVGIAMSVMLIFSEKEIDRKTARIILCLLPLLILFLCKYEYKDKNFYEYGIRTETDRSGTEFSGVLSDLLHIKDASKGTSWVTRETMLKACEVSPTLNSVREQLLSAYDRQAEENGDVDGDYMVMPLREAAIYAGAYDGNGVDTEQFYGLIHNELQQAFADGLLTREDDRLYISDVARGYSVSELKEYYGERFVDMIRMLLSYDHNETSIKVSNGDVDNLKLMQLYAGKNYITDDTDKDQILGYEKTVNMIEKIANLYKKTGKPICKLAILGFIVGIFCNLYAIKDIKEIPKRRDVEDRIWTIVISSGLFLTCLLLVFAVVWFCNFLTDWKVYDYCSAVIPIIELLEMIGIYLLLTYIIKIGKVLYVRIR